ncbi:MAG: c-type cytochrome [Candidatus Kapabacteria bacterium]|nr:c-type cytochrome [Candidatus Kapabacteria bacterium]
MEIKEGKNIFSELKCVRCHSVSSQGIKTKKEKAAKDLSEIGNSYNLTNLKIWIKRETKINGKKHPLVYKGEDSDLDVLIDWLVGLKSNVKIK